jgi:hypothetical protein
MAPSVLRLELRRDDRLPHDDLRVVLVVVAADGVGRLEVEGLRQDDVGEVDDLVRQDVDADREGDLRQLGRDLVRVREAHRAVAVDDAVLGLAGVLPQAVGEAGEHPAPGRLQERVLVAAVDPDARLRGVGRRRDDGVDAGDRVGAREEAAAGAVDRAVQDVQDVIANVVSVPLA